MNEVIKAKHEMALNLCEDGTIVSAIKADDSFVSAKIDAYRKEYKYMSDFEKEIPVPVHVSQTQ